MIIMGAHQCCKNTRAVLRILRESCRRQDIPLLIIDHDICDARDVLDKTNWEKAEGLLPDEIIGWIKKGDFVLEVGELNYKPSDCLPPFALRALRENLGKYVLDEDDWIVEKETGKRGRDIIGHPFPEIDPESPKAGEKIVYNCFYNGNIGGNFIAYLRTEYIRGSGYGRSTHGEMHNMTMAGNPISVARDNPDEVEKYTLFVARSPYDIAGSAVMTWRYPDPAAEPQKNVYGLSAVFRHLGTGLRRPNARAPGVVPQCHGFHGRKGS
jgi:hypothetical protein